MDTITAAALRVWLCLPNDHDEIRGYTFMSEQQNEQQQKPSLFRKKALDRISSPEELDHYLTVTGPGVWLPLLAVVALLLGAVVWMIFGHLDVTMGVAVESVGGTVVCYVPEALKDNALQGGEVSIAGTRYALSDIGYATQLVTEEMNVNLRRAGSLEMGAQVAPLLVDAELPQGVFTGEITVETVNPIKFVIN